MNNERHPAVIALIQALGLSAYIALVASLMYRIGDLMPTPNSPILGISFMLMLFVLSALVCGSIMLGYPLLLAKEGKIKKAIEIVGFSMIWIFVIMLLGILSILATQV